MRKSLLIIHHGRFGVGLRVSFKHRIHERLYSHFSLKKATYNSEWFQSDSDQDSDEDMETEEEEEEDEEDNW